MEVLQSGPPSALLKIVAESYNTFLPAENLTPEDRLQIDMAANLELYENSARSQSQSPNYSIDNFLRQQRENFESDYTANNAQNTQTIEVVTDSQINSQLRTPQQKHVDLGSDLNSTAQHESTSFIEEQHVDLVRTDTNSLITNNRSFTLSPSASEHGSIVSSTNTKRSTYNQLKIISHNVNGLNDPTKLNNLIDWMEETDMDLLGISETNLNETNCKFI